MQCDKKKAFETKEDAVKRISEIKEDVGKSKQQKPIRSYRCEICNKFHLTSWSKKEKQEIELKREIKKMYRAELVAEYWIKKKQWYDLVNQ